MVLVIVELQVGADLFWLAVEGLFFIELHFFELWYIALVVLDSSEANGIHCLFDSNLRVFQLSDVQFRFIDARRRLIELIDLDPKSDVILRMHEPEVRTSESLSAGLALVHHELALELC